MSPSEGGLQDPLVDGAWLQSRLGDPRLVVIDCTVTMTPRPVGPSRIDSGWPRYRAMHVPGAVYLHLLDDLAAPGAPTPYSLAPPAAIAERLRAIGVDEDSTLVVYASTAPMVATRAWWALRASGVRDVRVLDGGLEGWIAQGRPVDDRPARPRVGTFRGEAARGWRATQHEVLAAIDDPGTCLVNALSPEQFAGTGGAHYGRPGRIPRSVSLPLRDLIDPVSGVFLPLDVARERAQAVGALQAPRVIHYCGGGIAASGTFFVLERLGHRCQALYDHSLLEWSSDPAMPMVLGTAHA